MQKKYLYIGIACFVVISVLGWLFYESIKPLPGIKQSYQCDNFIDFSSLQIKNTDDKCRVHVPIGTVVDYPTNPPTLGPHYPDWIRAGVYTDVKDDRNLVHSLEHGYVEMFYKCNLDGKVWGPDNATESAQVASSSGQLDSKSECDQRKNQLEAIYNKKGQHKLIVAPRPNLDTNFALSAWQYLDKFDSFDDKRITDFISAHLENGPERTME